MTEEELFAAALEKPAAERAAFLEQACAGAAALRGRVEALLCQHEQAGSFLEKPPAGEAEDTGDIPPGQWVSREALASPPPEGPGTRIGPYKLLQKLGEGGMGAVFLAEQEQPVQRRVALKIIKAGLDSAHVLARFEAERQALALMDHPNIAKVLDAGATEAGRPYFVMELVKGVPITKFCDQEHLTPRERLELFIPVCQAVQHAHQKGVIHRDLKPSNVLVCLYDGKPVPKVIDFGVAKATAQKLTEKTMFTEVGQIVGTLEYMAPEQAELNNLDIDTRADIYSLGVLLYELLTGSPPFTGRQLRSAAFTEMLRMIREVEPPKPSTKLSGSDELPAIAAKRKLEPAKLTRLVQGELDWMVMKALEKDRSRRYETANGFARDIQRYLADEPVLAGPPSAGYRLRKFVRRNKGRVAAAAALALAVILGVAGVVAVQAKANHDLAAANRQLEQANEHVRQRFDVAMEAVGLFHGEVSKDLLLKEKQFDGLRNKLLRGAANFYQKLEALLKDQDDPASRATLGKAYHELGTLTDRIGDKPAALAVYRNALAVRRELANRPGAGPEVVLDVARTLIEIGRVQGNTGDQEGKLASFEEAGKIAEHVEERFGASDASQWVRARAYHGTGNALYSMNRITDSFRAFQRAREIRQTLVKAHPSDKALKRDLANSHATVAGYLMDDDIAQGMAEWQKSHDLFLAIAKADQSDLESQAELGRSCINFGAQFRHTGELTKELEFYEEGEEIYKRLTEANPSVTDFQEKLAFIPLKAGDALVKLGRPAEAKTAYERSRDLYVQLTEAHPKIPTYRNCLASDYEGFADLARAAGRLDEARDLYGQANAIHEELAKKDPSNVSLKVGLAWNARRRGLLEYAAERFAEAAAANQKSAELFEPLQQWWNVNIFELACCRAMQAALAGKDGSGVPASAGLAEADKAMDLLRKAVAAGHQNLYDFRDEPGLDSLRQRDDFKKLLAELEEKSKARAQAQQVGKGN
jgi:serine/threonine protein kinase/tetratricopeptide (TPR) repeat protein